MHIGTAAAARDEGDTTAAQTEEKNELGNSLDRARGGIHHIARALCDGFMSLPTHGLCCSRSAGGAGVYVECMCAIPAACGKHIAIALSL